ncbi:MAG: nitrilase-related carbon-nitrogen hydrolase [Candidatus Zixiibacteriota bacterium]
MASKNKKSSYDFRVGILQFKPKLGDVEYNLGAIKRYLSRRKFDLAVLPELATTGYNFPNRGYLENVSETRNGKSSEFFKYLSAKTGGAIVWGMAEKCRGKIYNTAILTTPEGDQFYYRKTHLFFREKELFNPGNTGFNVFEWRGVKIGLMICFDWIFPEAARTLALKGSQIICHPSNLVMHYCQDAMITRSIENGVFCALANRVGVENSAGINLKFTGGSQVTDIWGRRILQFTSAEQAFKTVKVNPSTADTKTVNNYNHLFDDRVVKYYQNYRGGLWNQPGS